MATMSGAHSAPIGPLRRLRLPILDTYLIAEFLPPFAFAFLAFFLFWGFNIFFLAAKYIIEASAPVSLVMQFLIYRIPQSIPMAFPFATFFATLLGVGRLMGDNEINALRTSGISLARFARTPFVFGAVVFLCTWAMNEYVAPRSVEISTRTFYQIVYHASSLPLDSQIFRRDPMTGNVIFVSSVSADHTAMNGVQIFQRGPAGYWNRSIQAQLALVEGPALVMRDAIVVQYDAQGYAQKQSIEHNVRVGLPLGESAEQFISTTSADPWAMNSKQLSAQIHALRSQGIGGEAVGNLETSLADKLAFPFAAVVSVLIALPMAIRFGRKGRVMGMALAIVGFFVYYIMTVAAAVFGSTGKINPYLAAWLPNAIFGLGGLALLWTDEH